MRKRVMILDAYNILHRIPAWEALLDESLEQARETLLRYCRRWMALRRDVWLFCVVFDSAMSGAESAASGGAGIRVFFPRGGESADDRIVRLLDEFASVHDCTVVSDDGELRNRTTRAGAAHMPPLAFAAQINPAIAPSPSSPGAARQCKPSKARRPLDAEKDPPLPPARATAITDSLRRLWEGRSES